MTSVDALHSNQVHSLCKTYFSMYHTNKQIPCEPETNVWEVLDYKLKPFWDQPAGFLGNHYLLQVKVLLLQSEGTRRTEEVQFFVKTTPRNSASALMYIDEFGVFKKENAIFREIIPKLEQTLTKFAPVCYVSDEKTLIFENLAQQGFKMATTRDGILNYEHLLCALKSLAAMHAASLIYETHTGVSLKTLYKATLEENSYPLRISQNHVRRKNFDRAVIVTQEIIKLLPKYKHQLDKVLQQTAAKMETIFQLAQTSEKYKNVLCHGDLWANNVMFKYGKYGEIPLECYFVDFQLARYAPPILDVITLLTIPTSSNFRQQHLDGLLHEYYTFLETFVRQQGLNIATILPRIEFNETINEYKICGLIESILFSHLTILPTDQTRKLTGSTEGFSDFFDSQRTTLCLTAYQTDAIYKSRLTDMIEDFVDHFVL